MSVSACVRPSSSEVRDPNREALSRGSPSSSARPERQRLPWQAPPSGPPRPEGCAAAATGFARCRRFPRPVAAVVRAFPHEAARQRGSSCRCQPIDRRAAAVRSVVAARGDGRRARSRPRRSGHRTHRSSVDLLARAAYRTVRRTSERSLRLTVRMRSGVLIPTRLDSHAAGPVRPQRCPRASPASTRPRSPAPPRPGHSRRIRQAPR